VDGITPGKARRMTRAQTLEVLAARGNRMAQLMLAGPEITPEDEKRLADWLPLPKPIAFAVRLALRSMRG